MTQYTVTKLRGDETAPIRRLYAQDPLTHPDVLYTIALHDVDPTTAAGILENPAADDKLKEIVQERFGHIYRYKDTVCPLLWNHISTFSNGDIRMCCEMIGEDADYGKARGDDGEVYNVHQHRLNHIRNSASARNLRKLMLNGQRPHECNQCWHRESLGMESKRTGALLQYAYEMPGYAEATDSDGVIDVDAVPLRNLDLRFGNRCNLKCRSCGPQDSDLWYEDYAKLNQHGDMWFYGDKKYQIITSDRGKTINTDDFSWDENSEFYQDLLDNLNTVDTIYFTGGEPTVIKQHRQLLEHCINTGIAQNIHLEYNTNMHATPVYLMQYWKNFRGVSIGASIDGYGVTQAYMRPPSTWQTVSTNILKLNDLDSSTISVRISPTISVMNILNLPSLIDWLLSQELNTVEVLVGNHTLYYPECYSVQILPPDVKRYVLAYYEAWFNRLQNSHPDLEQPYRVNLKPVLDYMMEVDASDRLPEFLEKTGKLDAIRNHDWTLGLPDLHGVLKAYDYL